MDVLLLVFESTFLTITAQYKEGPSGLDLFGKLPGTTTEYAGTFPKVISPVDLSTILAVSYTHLTLPTNREV